MCARAVVLALALVLTPLGAQAADLVIWWEQGFYPQEDQAVREIIAAFEQKTGKQVELVQPAQDEVFDRVQAALAAGQPPDFLYSIPSSNWTARWAYDGRLVDLEDALGRSLDLFDADTIEASTLLDGKIGRRGLYALPMGRNSNHIHVWNSLLERAGFTLADIPKEWEAFWSFWCDQVQPAVRKALGRDDIWGVGLPMSVAATADTDDELLQFQLAYGTPWLDRDRRLQVDDPAVRAGLLHRHLAQGLHAARLDELDQHRQQQGISRSDRGDDAEYDALDPGRAAHGAARRLLQKRRDHRLAERRQWPAPGH
jgi:multiple sugar transport system substrate-binding protein